MRSMSSVVNKSNLALLPAGVFLFSLPFAHTVAVRLLCLAIASVTTAVSWYLRPPPPVPCKLPILLWAVICALSVTWSIEPAYSAGELWNEVGYTMLSFLTFFYFTRSESDWRLWRRIVITSFVTISIYAIYNYLRAGLRLHIVPPHVFRAPAVGPEVLVGDAAGVATDALVQVEHHRDVRANVHRLPPSPATIEVFPRACGRKHKCPGRGPAGPRR